MNTPDEKLLLSRIADLESTVSAIRAFCEMELSKPSDSLIDQGIDGTCSFVLSILDEAA